MKEQATSSSINYKLISMLLCKLKVQGLVSLQVVFLQVSL